MSEKSGALLQAYSKQLGLGNDIAANELNKLAGRFTGAVRGAAVAFPGTRAVGIAANTAAELGGGEIIDGVKEQADAVRAEFGKRAGEFLEDQKYPEPMSANTQLYKAPLGRHS